MANMILVIDESGAKGYAKTQEKFAGEIGVMAGFLYPEVEMQFLELNLNRLIAPFYDNCYQKFHITDLDPRQQSKLREDLFALFRMRKLQWFYIAIYSEGFHQSEFKEGRGGFQNNKESLHTVLYQGILTKALDLSHSIQKYQLNLMVKTDHIDDAILKAFQRNSQNVVDLIMGTPTDIFAHRYNSQTGRYEKICAQQQVSSESLPKFDFISIKIEREVSSLTIAADVLANSVNYYLKSDGGCQKNKFLNNRKAIKNHPLANSALVPDSEGTVFPYWDIVYRRE